MVGFTPYSHNIYNQYSPIPVQQFAKPPNLYSVGVQSSPSNSGYSSLSNSKESHSCKKTAFISALIGGLGMWALTAMFDKK
jgi:hypothetical protein